MLLYRKQPWEKLCNGENRLLLAWLKVFLNRLEIFEQRAIREPHLEGAGVFHGFMLDDADAVRHAVSPSGNRKFPLRKS